MKQLIKNYTINSGTNTITLTDFGTLIPERLLLITDVTNQTTLYQFNSTTGVSFATNVITFTALGVSGNSDKLQIYYDVAAGDPVYDSGELQAKITNGTNIADVVAGDSGFNGVATASATKTYTFTTSSSGAQTILANTPTEGFSWVEVVYTSVGSGLALTGQWSNASGGTYVAPGTWNNTLGGALGVSASSVYWSGIYGNYFQIAVSALTSGTFSGYIILHAAPQSLYNVGATQNGAWTVGSNSSTGSSIPANAFFSGLLAKTALPTAVSDGQLVGTMGDKFGRSVVLHQAPRDLVGMQETTITSSTTSTTVLTAAASIFADITSITLANSSATATLATLSDGTNSYIFYVPGGDTRGAAYQVPLAATTVNTAWTLTCGTSVASLYVTITYVKNR
jgi:hypothetical protein